MDNKESILQIMKNMANTMLKMQRQISDLTQELAEAEGRAGDAVTITKENIRQYAIGDLNFRREPAKMRFLNRNREKR